MQKAKSKYSLSKQSIQNISLHQTDPNISPQHNLLQSKSSFKFYYNQKQTSINLQSIYQKQNIHQQKLQNQNTNPLISQQQFKFLKSSKKIENQLNQMENKIQRINSKITLKQHNPNQISQNISSKSKSRHKLYNNDTIGLLIKLRDENEMNQRIISQMKKRIKDLEGKLCCFELSNNELRLKLHQSRLEVKILKQKIYEMRNQKIQADIKTKKYLLDLQQKINIQKTVFFQSQNLFKNQQTKQIQLQTSFSQSLNQEEEDHFKQLTKHPFKLKSFKTNLKTQSSLKSSDISFSNTQTNMLNSKIQKIQQNLEKITTEQKMLKIKNKLIQSKLKQQ